MDEIRFRLDQEMQRLKIKEEFEQRFQQQEIRQQMAGVMLELKKTQQMIANLAGMLQQSIAIDQNKTAIIERLMHVLAAPAEIMRDSQTGRATGIRRVIH